MKKKAKIKSNSIHNIMMLTCMKKKKAKFKSYSIQNVMMVTCMQKRLKIKSLLNGMEVTCMQKRVKIMFNSIQNAREITCCSPGQVWVINSNFFLQLNLCVCYRENQFELIIGPGRALLTLPRSHICLVNKFVRKKSRLILVIVTGTFNRPVLWFINSLLPKWTNILGGSKDCRPR